ITAGEVIRLLDGRIAPMGCVSTHDYEPCEFEAGCGLKSLWARARAALVGVLDQTTIADLCTPADYSKVVSLKTSSKR
ncbi:MAG TPA: Rrf2 family transcriptional regulator, partial [Blastocatellia bacterium]|nr:Rrf2 family transcriptional regulator [Blastocatellia bacterium]